MEHVAAAADQFRPHGRVAAIREHGNGNVNDTYLVTLEGAGERYLILQRINTQVFRQPELIMRNMHTFTEHVRRRLQRDPLVAGRRWEMPRVFVAQDGRDYWLDPAGRFWRAISFVDAAQSFDTIQSAEHAREVGYALGMFHHLISDLPSGQLADTLEGFHITPRYLRHYDEVTAAREGRHSPEVTWCLRFIAARRGWASILEDARAQGKLLPQPIHGDPKVNNVMIDSTTRQAVSIVDLDTVKPGLVHYDIGDCLRSCCNRLGEETEQWQAVCFEPDLCRPILQGYLSLAKRFLTANDYDYLYDAIRLIAFELGLRFFTDHLEGNVYFRARQPGHNLARALVQFRLTESIEAQEAAIRAIIQDQR